MRACSAERRVARTVKLVLELDPMQPQRVKKSRQQLHTAQNAQSHHGPKCKRRHQRESARERAVAHVAACEALDARGKRETAKRVRRVAAGWSGSKGRASEARRTISKKHLVAEDHLVKDYRQLLMSEREGPEAQVARRVGDCAEDVLDRVDELMHHNFAKVEIVRAVSGLTVEVRGV